MIATQDETLAPQPPLDPRWVREALDRGEIVQLLALVESGRMSPDQLEAAIAARERDRWFARLLQTLFGR